MGTTTERPDELIEILAGEFQRILGWVIIRDEKASGTNSGTFTAGAWQTRVLNTTVINTIGASYTLAANQFTLPAGNYIIKGSAPAWDVDFHATRLQNITDGTTAVSGTGEWASSATTNNSRSFLMGAFHIASAKTFEVQHQCSTTRATSGFGLAVGGLFAVQEEVFTQIEICKMG